MDQMLKQRLIGAIVIISLAVIFIPMILEGPDDEPSPRTQDMPPPPAIDYQAEVELPVPAESSGPSGSPESSEPSGSPAAVVAEQAVSAIPQSAPPQETVASPAASPAKQAEPVESKQAPRTVVARQSPVKTPPSDPSAGIQGGWVVQVGSFSQQANALSLRDRLKKSGYQVTVQDAKGTDGSVHRVLVGPVSDRPAAEKLRDKLAREQKLTAMVLENK
jgi:DedD protein